MMKTIVKTVDNIDIIAPIDAIAPVHGIVDSLFIMETNRYNRTKIDRYKCIP